MHPIVIFSLNYCLQNEKNSLKDVNLCFDFFFLLLYMPDSSQTIHVAFFSCGTLYKKSTFFLPLSCIVARTEIALQTLHLLIKISLRQEMRHCYICMIFSYVHEQTAGSQTHYGSKKYTIRWSRFSFFFKADDVAYSINFL